MAHSTSPEGEKFNLPEEEDYKKEYERLSSLVSAHKKEGREIVVVMGLGFVGAVMAAVVADSADKTDRQAVQVCHRHAAAQHQELLEDPPVQPRCFAGACGGPGSGPHDRAVCQTEEKPDRHIHL